MTDFLKIATISGGMSLAAGMATAQGLTESQIVADSGSGAYPITLVASDGQTYRCKRELEVRNGRRARICVPVRAGGAGGAAVAGLLGLVAIASSDGT